MAFDRECAAESMEPSVFHVQVMGEGRKASISRLCASLPCTSEIRTGNSGCVPTGR